jgi:hypothetical protein
MTVQKFTEMLHGREIGNELSREEAKLAKSLGFLVVYGASDDLLEFDGAFRDEVGACNGTKLYIDRDGVKPTWGDDAEKTEFDAREYFRREDMPAFKIIAAWAPEGSELSWNISIDSTKSDGSPQWECFEIMEDGSPFCRGLVIDFGSWIRSTKGVS